MILPEPVGEEEISLKLQYNLSMYGDWVIAKGSSIGARHLEDNMPCQDAYNVFYDNELNYGIAVVSDGAGSAQNSEKGSQFIVNEIVDIFRDKVHNPGFNALLEADKHDIDLFFISVFKQLRMQLEKYAKSIDMPMESLAATVILILFSRSGLICSHIGDGRAGFQDLNDNWHPVLEPYKGSYANHTVFITSDVWENPKDYIRTTVINQPIQSFTLMSDGCENATFELNRFNEETQMYERLNNPYPKFFNPNVNALRELHKSGKTAMEIDELWTSFLKNGNKKFESEVDDKTLILGTLTDKNCNA